MRETQLSFDTDNEKKKGLAKMFIEFKLKNLAWMIKEMHFSKEVEQ